MSATSLETFMDGIPEGTATFWCKWCRKHLDVSTSAANPKRQGTNTSCAECQGNVRSYMRAIRNFHWRNVKNDLICVNSACTVPSEIYNGDHSAIIQFDHYDPFGNIHPRNARTMLNERLFCPYDFKLSTVHNEGSPETKVGTGSTVSGWITKGVGSYSWAFFEEVLKCIVLCANCHSAKTQYESCVFDKYRSNEGKERSIGSAGARGEVRDPLVGKRPQWIQRLEMAGLNNDQHKRLTKDPIQEISYSAHLHNLKHIYVNCYNMMVSRSIEFWDIEDPDDWTSWRWNMERQVGSSIRNNKMTSIVHNQYRNDFLNFDIQGRMIGEKN